MFRPSQVTAAAASVRIGGKFYRMSPLSDRDIQELELWSKARLQRIARDGSAGIDGSKRRMAIEGANRLDAGWLAGAGASLMSAPECIAQIVWTGISKNHPMVTAEDIRNAMSDNPAATDEAIFEFSRINATEGIRGGGCNNAPESSKDALYRGLAEKYGWTFDQIADMTPAQQLMAIAPNDGPKTAVFETRAEAEAFMRQTKG